MLRFENINKDFTDNFGMKITVIGNVDLLIQQGEFLSFLGPSGCGKSTLINIIAGLVPPTSGAVSVNGKVVTAPGKDRAVVFQESCLLPWLTVNENVAMALPADTAAVKDVRDYYVNMVKLRRFQNAYPHQLSGGMKQRAALARALATESPVLLMDEPFSALDEQTRMLLQNELIEIWQRTNKTIVFVTHNIREAICLSDRIVMLSHHPATIISELKISADRPRLSSAQLLEFERSILRQLKHEIEKAAEEELGESYIF